jgi:hypothetical protein
MPNEYRLSAAHDAGRRRDVYRRQINLIGLNRPVKQLHVDWHVKRLEAN